MHHAPSRVVKVGSLMMGGQWPVSIQTMWKSPLERFSGASDPAFLKARAQLNSLYAMGCDAVRFAVPDEETVIGLGALAAESPVPLVADIHFDWRLALKCMDYPIAKIRINPGNIGAAWKLVEVVEKAKDRDVALRIGVNAGSLPSDLRSEPDEALACLTAAEREMAAFDELGFSNFLVSMKLNQPEQVERANRLFASRHDVPLHLGVTEAGPLIAGVTRNAAALVPLLKDGIGATIRVSLSDSMENEVIAAREIIGCAGIRRTGVRIVSCPRCGRASFDTHGFTSRWADRLYEVKDSLEIAIMGCVVNGPGEARHADLGITGSGDYVLIFRKGEITRKVRIAEVDDAFREELQKALTEKNSDRR